MQWVATRPLYFLGFLAAFDCTGTADNYSGCSEYANDLPVIVDGNYYGCSAAARDALAEGRGIWRETSRREKT
jgi:hypothetical protein